MDTLAIVDGRVLLPDLSVAAADVVIDRDGGDVVAIAGRADDGDIDSGGDTDSAGRDAAIDDGVATDVIDTAIDPISDPAEAVAAADDALEAANCLVMPGLVNAHTHVAMTLLRGYADDKELDAWLREDVWPVEGALTPADVRSGTDLGLLEMIRSGTTAFADMYFHEERIADAVADAGLRACLGFGVVTATKEAEAAADEAAQSVEFAREVDGRADGRIRGAVMPHSLTTVGEEYLRELVAGAREADLPVHLHANETRDEVEPIVAEHDERPLEYADEIGALGPADFLAHGVHCDATEIDLLAERGTAVVHCPASNMKLASGMAPVQAMRDAGVTVAIGTDGAASNNDLDVFDELRDAAMLGKLQTGRADAVPAAAAVEMATRGGARALGLDSGRIEPGANADLAVLDLDAAHLTPAHDLVSHLAYAARGSDVRHTVCDGEVLMRDREVLALDADDVRERARAAAAEAVARAKSD